MILSKVGVLEVDANLFIKKTRASVFYREPNGKFVASEQASEQRTAKRVQGNFLYD